MTDKISDAVQRALVPDEQALAKIRGQHKLTARERIDLLVDKGSFVEDGVLANAIADRLPADGVVTGRGRGRRDARRDRRQRPDGQGRFVGCAHRGEDDPGDRDVARRAGADRVARRLGRRSDHRPGAAVPRAPRCGADLLQPEPDLGQGAADLLPVRPVGGRRRLRAVVLRCRVHGRRQRVDVPRFAAHGRDGRRRDHHVGGDGRRPDARDAVGLRRQSGRRRRGRSPPGSRLPVVLPAFVGGRSARLRERAARRPARRRPRSPPTSASRSTSTR